MEIKTTINALITNYLTPISISTRFHTPLSPLFYVKYPPLNTLMTQKNIKSDMIRLWKDTFHDSDNYIRLVFDNYFDERYIRTVYDGEKLISALLGIPYYFRNKYTSMRGLYLCGLATIPSYRSRGIMTGLINEINCSAKKDKFDFTFLIPADEHLTRYYSKLLYLNCSYYEETIIEKSQFEDIVPYLHEEIINWDNIVNVVEFINNLGIDCDFWIQHSLRDIEAVIADSDMDSGTILLLRDIKHNIQAILFATNPDAEKVTIKLLLATQTAAYCDIIAQLLKRMKPGATLILRTPARPDIRPHALRSAGPDVSRADAETATTHADNLAAVPKPFMMARMLQPSDVCVFRSARPLARNSAILAIPPLSTALLLE